MESGSNVAGRAITSDPRDPCFKSQHGLRLGLGLALGLTVGLTLGLK